MPRLSGQFISRRGLLAGIGAAAVSRKAGATIVNLVAMGRDGWLFPIWDEVRHVDLKRIGPVAEVCNEAASILMQADIQVVFAVVPIKSRIYSDFLPEDFRFSVDSEKRYALALEALRRPGTLVPDLLASLSALRTASRDPVFFKGDTHWTATAAQAAATEIAHGIRDKIRFPASTHPGIQLGQPIAALQEKNDLADLLPPADRARYPLETYRVRQALEAPGGAGLAEDDTADVVVIGNSFMQPRLGFAPMLSNQLNRPVSLVWKVHQYGPYQTLLSYFASDQFRRRRPRVLVWNIHETDITIPSDRRDGWGQNVIAPQAFLTTLRQVVG